MQNSAVTENHFMNAGHSELADQAIQAALSLSLAHWRRRESRNQVLSLLSQGRVGGVWGATDEEIGINGATAETVAGFDICVIGTLINGWLGRLDLTVSSALVPCASSKP